MVIPLSQRRHQFQTVEGFLDVRNHGFVRVAGISPPIFLGDPHSNAENHLRFFAAVRLEGAYYAVGPELGLTGYTCEDLHHAQVVLEGALEALEVMLERSKDWNLLMTIGMALVVDDALYNCAVTFFRGQILGVVPKAFPPEYREFYEGRFFARATEARSKEITLLGQRVPFGWDLLFQSERYPWFVLHTSICEDIWRRLSPCAFAAAAGAVVEANLSASNITIGKDDYRRLLVRTVSGMDEQVVIYTAAGKGESTTNAAWDGTMFIAERGDILAAGTRFSETGEIAIRDVDLLLVKSERMKQSSFHQSAADFGLPFRTFMIPDRHLGEKTDPSLYRLVRKIDPHPFVPSDPELRDQRCYETVNIQVSGVMGRLNYLPKDMRKLSIGVSGGQDSTLALLVAVQAMDRMELPRSNIFALTMDGFGTTKRTKTNAVALINALGVTHVELDIRPIVLEFFKAIGHDEREETLVFENAQAWTRKILELAIACQHRGINLGTGDLSELFRGWCTMFGDHASHYNPNAGVAKTLVSYLIRWAADVVFVTEPEVQGHLCDILATPISPELLRPNADGSIGQVTEELVGPYPLTDFFQYWLWRFSMSPSKVYRMSLQAFDGAYEPEVIYHWLEDVIVRFFRSQVKRSVMPDGAKVGLLTANPRGDLRVPSDMRPTLFLRDLSLVPPPEVLVSAHELWKPEQLTSAT